MSYSYQRCKPPKEKWHFCLGTGTPKHRPPEGCTLCGGRGPGLSSHSDKLLIGLPMLDEAIASFEMHTKYHWFQRALRASGGVNRCRRRLQKLRSTLAEGSRLYPRESSGKPTATGPAPLTRGF